ncbi:nucleoside triphosphate pyrophosphohydrolase [Clostridia bacterium]|nr:nucleoside triphosphate pyrophosphohydrolase [Clostridia bacterium]
MKNLNTGKKLEEFIEIMKRLLSPNGCPWDRKQTHDSLKRYLIEESYEVYEAIEENSMEKLQDELGDVLMQVVFHSALAEQSGAFTLDDVIDGVQEKMIRRHPHVFADSSVNSAKEVEIRWEEIKKEEKSVRKNQTLMDIPKAMDPLYRAEKLQQRAAKVGFDWPDLDGAMGKVDEEILELKAAIDQKDRQEIEAELGDVFFSLVNIARKMDMDSVDALQATNDKFVRRFQMMESKAQDGSLDLNDLRLEQLESWWQEAKKELQ